MSSEPNQQMNLIPRRLKLSVGLFGLAVWLLTLAACGDEDSFPARPTTTAEPPGTNVSVPPLPPSYDDHGPHHRPPGFGEGCNLGTQCVSGFCVNHVCCSAACLPRQFCDLPGRRGQCADPADNGNRCSYDAQCLSGFCVDDGVCCGSASCPSGQFCNTGECRPPAPDGAPCGLYAGAECNSSFCVDNVCCGTATCPPGDSCGLLGHEGECSPLPTPTPAGLGAPCASGTQCSSGNCVDGVCCSVSSCPDSEACNIYPDLGHCKVRPTATPTRTRVPTPAPTPLPIKLRVVSAVGLPGEQVTFSVVLENTTEALIAGTQNDLTFDSTNAPIAAKPDDTPDCSVNPAIHKDASAFGFLPAGCTGTECTGIRAIVFATDSVDPILAGSVLYACTVDISADAADGQYPLAVSGIVVSSPHGFQLLGVEGFDGAVVVGSGGPPPNPPGVLATAVVDPGPTPPPADAPSIGINATAGSPGERVTFSVTLSAAGASVAGTQNDIVFDSVNTPIAGGAYGRPDCVVNPDINKRSTIFGFLPPGCRGAACTSLRALVFALDNVDAIPDGSVLYTCKVDIALTAADGEYPLAISGVTFSDPNGADVPHQTGVDGAVVVAPR